MILTSKGSLSRKADSIIDFLISLTLFFALYLASYALVHRLEFSVASLLVFSFFAGVFLRGDHLLDDCAIVFLAIVGIVPILGWVNLPSEIEPILVITSFWLLIGIKTRRFRPTTSIALLGAPILAFLATFFYWKELAEGSSVSVLSRLFGIWDTSAHFYFFFLNLEFGTFIPRIARPIDGGMNQWSGIEYPTGIHFVWSKFAGSLKADFIAQPTSSIPFFANAMVLTLAFSVFILVVAIIRISSRVIVYVYASVFAFAFALAVVGLGIFSQTISSGFVNISIVLACAALMLSHLIKPARSRIRNDLLIAAAVLGAAYNWYPVLLFLAPPLVVYAFSRLQESQLRSRLLILFFFISVSIISFLPILQTFSLGVSHLSENGGVVRLSPNWTALVVTIGALLLVQKWSDFSWLERSLLISPPIFNVGFAFYFRLTDGDYRYYFHKINMFAVVIAIIGMICLMVEHVDRSALFSKSGVRSRTTVAILFGSLASMQLFGYIGPDAHRFAGAGSLLGLTQRQESINLKEVRQRTAELLVRAADQTIDLPLHEKAWLMLALPNRITQLEVSDGSHIILSNVWLHSLNKSQTLTAFQTAYVAVNLEVRGALSTDDSIAAEMPNVFQPDSVTVFSTREVIEFLNSDVLPWRTLEFDGVAENINNEN